MTLRLSFSAAPDSIDSVEWCSCCVQQLIRGADSAISDLSFVADGEL